MEYPVKKIKLLKKEKEIYEKNIKYFICGYFTIFK